MWEHYKRLYDRLESLGLTPKSAIFDGSFVTGRESPGDVDFGAFFQPRVIKQALSDVEDPADIQAIKDFMKPASQIMIRSYFGAHMMVVQNEFGLKLISKLFRTGGEQFGKLKDPDPKRDPDWVTIPREKGILRVNFY